MGKTVSGLGLFCRIAIVAVMFVCGVANALAQDAAGWKEKPVTLRVSNQPLGKVLEMVAEAANAKITLYYGKLLRL